MDDNPVICEVDIGGEEEAEANVSDATVNEMEPSMAERDDGQLPGVDERCDDSSEQQHSGEDEEEEEVQDVLVATPAGLLSANQLRERLNTTHIVIHDVIGSSIDELSVGLKTPKTPLTPGSPGSCSTPNLKFKYNWDDSVHDPILPVRCKSLNGELHKAKFGSGGKGKCIYSKEHNQWVTPSDFEILAGRGNSKDWKRSIRYGGRTLNCLIREEILQPHAATCICASCCDDDSVNGPVRLFTPYKRRRKENGGLPAKRTDNRLNSTASINSNKDEDSSSALPKDLLVAAPVEPTITTTAEEPMQVIMGGGVVTANAIVIGPQPVNTATATNPMLTTKSLSSLSLASQDVGEQRMWWQLEEMVKTFLNYGLELKQLVEQMKAKTTASREAAIQAVKIEMEEEKKQALNTARIETEMTLSRTWLEARAEKEIAIQQALNQARAEMNEKLGTSSTKGCSQKCLNCNRDAVGKFIGVNNLPYCSLFCQKKDWSVNKQEYNRLFATTTSSLDEPDISEELKGKNQ